MNWLVLKQKTHHIEQNIPPIGDAPYNKCHPEYSGPFGAYNNANVTGFRKWIVVIKE